MNKITITLLLSSCFLLLGCPHRTMVSNAKVFYKKNNNMLCVNHSRNIEKGVLTTLYDDNVTIPLNKTSPETSCATFSINDKITIKSANNNHIEITPYHVYNFYTGLLKKDMTEGGGSGFGPRICFVKDEQNQYVLNIENTEDLNKMNSKFCSK